MRLLEHAFFALLLLTIPIQLGKHFWPQFAFVQGIRVDYLSPTLYLSDIAIIGIFIFSIHRLRGKFIRLCTSRLSLGAFLVIFLGLLFSEQKGASFFGLTKFLEFFYLAFYISHTWRKKYWNTTLFLLILGGAVQSALLIMQFVNQASIGGIFYYLGERYYTPQTIGIALFGWGEQLLLRPYGSFPHPNVAGYFLFTVFALVLWNRAKTFGRVFRLLILIILLIGILVTFSRVIILYTLIIVSIYAFKNIKGTAWLVAGVGIFFGVIFSALYAQRFFGGLTIDLGYRFELMKIAFQIFMSFPMFGTGLNNFFIHEISFQRNITPVLLQPVHNVYIMWIVQTGIAGGLIMAVFLKAALGRLIFCLNSPNKYPFAVSVPVIIAGTLLIGMFDHYPVTLQQGQLLTAFSLGLLFAKR